MLISLSKIMSSLKIGFISKYVSITSIYSIKSLKILNIIYKLGYIRGFSFISFNKIKIYLKYIKNSSVLRNLYLVSKPSRKFYMTYLSLKGSIINNFVFVNGFMLISTNKGILTDVEAMFIKKGGNCVLFIS
jgi:small subunit ribosomal protein S8